MSDKFIAINFEMVKMWPGDVIPVGTMFLFPCDPQMGLGIPEYTLMLEGQSLSRADYPELSALFTDTGGFYEFTLPDLRERFMIGNGDYKNELARASAGIYYKTVKYQKDK